jgi:hypothetical protein
MKTKARVIAYYLPQFHPIPENDKYWGKGFTEWTNVAKAKPLFRGHYQPQIPADFGFYDLRLPEVREAQAQMARECGVEGFCYWHYWFGNGKKVLERPFDEVLRSGKPNFPFCLGWANHDWNNKTWEKGNVFTKDVTIFKQEYPGDEDNIAHFYDLLPAFKDDRYILVDGKPIFCIFDLKSIPNTQQFIKLWSKLALENGLKGIHFVALAISIPQINIFNLRNLKDVIIPTYQSYLDLGVDAVNSISLKYAEARSDGIIKKGIKSFSRKYFNGVILDKFKYEEINKYCYTEEDEIENTYPQLIPRRDRSPRSGRKATIYYGSTPEKFRIATKRVLECVKRKQDQHKIIFLNSWNEWGEGCYMEPDLVYGHGYLDVLREEIYE